MDATEKNPLVETVRWLEDEYRQIKIQAAKIQQQLDQLQARAWEQADRLRTLEESSSHSDILEARLSRIEDELRNTKELLERLQAAQVEEVPKFAEAQRQWQAEIERDRQARAELWHKIDLLEKQEESSQKKHKSIDDTVRRHQETFLQIAQRLDNLKGEDENFSSKLVRCMENIKRCDQEIVRIDREMEAMRKQDEVVQTRAELIADQMKRVEQQNIEIMEGETARQELAERVNLLKAEKQRLEQNVMELERVDTEHRERLEWQGRQLNQLESKVKSNLDRLTNMQQQLWDYRQQILDRFSEYAEVEEEQKRRQIAEMERQIKDVRKHISKPVGDR